MPKWTDWNYGESNLHLKGIVVRVFWDHEERGYRYYTLGLTSRETFKMLGHAQEAGQKFIVELLQENLKMMEVKDESQSYIL